MKETINDTDRVFEIRTKSQYRILLLEDNMISMQEHTDILHSAGYDLDYAIAGHNLLEIVHKKKFDLVLINFTTKGIHIYDLIKKVKGSATNEDTPIVLITDHRNNNENMLGLHISSIDFLKTPYSREELLTRINNQIKFFKSKQQLQQSKLIAQSIQYAERIQKAITPSESVLNDLFNDHWVINMPRDVVSGDFFWLKRKGSRTIVALADCTGHGVPGAFLSVLGISLLNEITSQYRLESAGEILDQLRNKMKRTLLKEESTFPLTDGMDISLIIIDSKNKSLQFAGANHKIIMTNNKKITDLRGDLQPIGIYPVEKHYTNHEVKIEPGMRVYLTTDGYTDQFGGEHNKKLQYRRYRQLINETCHLDLKEQKRILIAEHLKWKGINDQLDDILLMGLELK